MPPKALLWILLAGVLILPISTAEPPAVGPAAPVETAESSAAYFLAPDAQCASFSALARDPPQCARLSVESDELPPLEQGEKRKIWEKVMSAKLPDDGTLDPGKPLSGMFNVVVSSQRPLSQYGDISGGLIMRAALTIRSSEASLDLVNEPLALYALGAQDADSSWFAINYSKPWPHGAVGIGDLVLSVRLLIEGEGIQVNPPPNATIEFTVGAIHPILVLATAPMTTAPETLTPPPSQPATSAPQVEAAAPAQAPSTAPAGAAPGLAFGLALVAIAGFALARRRR